MRASTVSTKSPASAVPAALALHLDRNLDGALQLDQRLVERVDAPVTGDALRQADDGDPAYAERLGLADGAAAIQPRPEASVESSRVMPQLTWTSPATSPAMAAAHFSALALFRQSRGGPGRRPTPAPTTAGEDALSLLRPA